MTSINLKKLRARDEQVLSELFKELMPTLRKAVRGFHADIDPDEVVAEALAQLIRDTDRLADLINSGNLETYCLRITRNIALHQIRRTMVQKRVAVELPLKVELEADEEYGNEELLQLKKALGNLASTDRALIEMFYVQGKSTAEVAQSLGVSSGAVRVKLHRTLARLRNNMKLEGGAVK
jgi:RNA polymerase sigma-70 factor (ECF subfamily)